jgi:hypothetical protein
MDVEGIFKINMENNFKNERDVDTPISLNVPKMTFKQKIDYDKALAEFQKNYLELIRRKSHA